MSNPDLIQVLKRDEEKDKERKKKPGRSRKIEKKVDPEEIERDIIAKTERAPKHIDDNLLNIVTASDLSAQAHLSSLEILVQYVPNMGICKV